MKVEIIATEVPILIIPAPVNGYRKCTSIPATIIDNPIMNPTKHQLLSSNIYVPPEIFTYHSKSNYNCSRKHCRSYD